MYYKVLKGDGMPYHGGNGRWSLPTKNDGTWRPGEWMPAIEGELVACVHGYHLCREGDLVQWLGPAIFEAEYRGEMVEDENKIVVREARLLRRFEAWNERAARLFACDCATRSLPIYERDRPDDNRPREAIAVARRYANGEATAAELAGAWAAAWDAKLDAARAAARAAAWDAERAWQTKRLMEYLAADAA